MKHCDFSTLSKDHLEEKLKLKSKEEMDSDKQTHGNKCNILSENKPGHLKDQILLVISIRQQKIRIRDVLKR